MVQDTIKDGIDSMRGLSADDVLAALGLERRRTMLDVMMPAVGIFAAGAAIGAGLALLFAPKSGKDMRKQLEGSAKEITRRIGTTAEEMAEDVRHAMVRGDEDAVQKPHVKNGIGTERRAESPPVK